MAKLEELIRGATIKGILPDQWVTIVDVQWIGSTAVELTYQDATGRPANKFLDRHSESTLEIAAVGSPCSFEGGGGLRRAVFLDRDGVLVEDQGLLVRKEQICLLEGVASALRQFKAAGMFLAMVSNQAVVARGLISENELVALNHLILERIQQAGGPPLDAVYFCPHHPEATLLEYRMACQCRKPRPGMIVQAGAEHGLDLQASFLVGDRMSDIAAGAAAGCRTVLVTCGQHDAPPIVTVDRLDSACRPDHTCLNLLAATEWILRQVSKPG